MIAKIVPHVILCGICVCSAVAAEPDKPMFLSAKLNHSVTGDSLAQIIEITEGSTFRVVTTAGGIRWTIAGKAGKSENGVLLVNLILEWYKAEDSQDRHKRLEKMTVDKRMPGYGIGNGVSRCMSVWTKMPTETQLNDQ